MKKDLTSHEAVMGRTKDKRHQSLSINTVGDLINELKQFDPKSEVIFYDDESSTPFEVESVVNVDVERTRDKRNCPRLKFGKTESFNQRGHITSNERYLVSITINETKYLKA